MRRKNCSLPSYRLHKPSGRAVVTLAGKDVYLGAYGSAASRREYQRHMSEWLAAGSPPRSADPNDFTVVELCAAYWRHAKRYYRYGDQPSGELHPIRAVIKLLKASYGPTLAMKFGPLALKALRLQMVALKWTRSTINKQTGRVRRIFRWAASEELLPASVHQALATVDGLRAGRTDATESQPVRPVADTDVEVTLKCLPPMVADMVRLQRLTGARPGEICAMRPAEIDRTSSPWIYRPATHKTSHLGKERVILIGPKAQLLLEPYLTRASEVPCFSPAESEQRRREQRHQRRATPIGYGNSPGTNRKKKPKLAPGDRYTPGSYRRAIERACDLAERATSGPPGRKSRTSPPTESFNRRTFPESSIRQAAIPSPTTASSRPSGDIAISLAANPTSTSTSGSPSIGVYAKYGTIIKDYKNASMIYTPSEMVGAKRTGIRGINESEERTITTSHVERLNGTQRLFIKRLNRLTLCFSKKLENLEAAFAIFAAHYNYCWQTRKPGKSGKKRGTAAMMAKLAGHVWSFDELFEAVLKPATQS